LRSWTRAPSARSAASTTQNALTASTAGHSSWRGTPRTTRPPLGRAHSTCGDRKRTMKNLIAILALVVGAWADQSLASINASALTGTPGARGCFDPADYRAFYPEATDDRLSMQRAIDEACFAGGGEVCIGPGTFNVSRAPAGSYNRFAALSLH